MTRTTLHIALLIGLPACGADTRLSGPLDLPLPARCDAVLAELVADPAGSEVVAHFSAPVADHTWAVGVDAVEGHTTLAADRLSARFTPDVPLEPGLQATAWARACADELEQAFTPAPQPVAPADLLGRRWWVRTDAPRWTDPALAGWLSAHLPAWNGRVVEVVAADAAQAELAVWSASAEGAPERLCAPTPIPPLDLRANPVGVLGPITLRDPAGLSPTFEGVRLEGTLAAHGTVLTRLVLTGAVDLRSVSVDPETVCALASAAGTPCVPCADGAGACLPLHAQLPDAHPAPDTLDDDAYCAP